MVLLFFFIDEETEAWSGRPNCLWSQQLIKWQSQNLYPGFDQRNALENSNTGSSYDYSHISPEFIL